MTHSPGLAQKSAYALPLAVRMCETLRGAGGAVLKCANIQKHKIDILKPDGFKQDLLSLLVASFAINILSLALPVMTLQVYDRILPNPGTGTLPVLITGVCLAVFLESCLRLSRSYVLGRSSAAYEHRMACNAISKILNADLSKIGSYGIGEHLHRMACVGKLKDFYNGYAITVLTELMFVPLFFGLIVYIGRGIAIVPAAVLCAFVIVSIWRGKHLRAALKQREIVDDKRFNFLIESLEGVHTLKAFSLEKFFERRYEALEEDSTFENYNVTQETAATFNSGTIFSHLMVASVITSGAWFVLHGMLTTGGLIATMLLSGRIMQPVQKALALWARYQDYVLAREHIENLFSTPQQTIVERSSTLPRAQDGTLVLSQVSFRYHNDPDFLFHDITLEIKRGDAVLISGEHGAGKTTLLDLISGIYPPSGGEILVDGENINTYAPDELVHHIGFIRTSPLIFRGTIRDNITCFGQTNESKAQEVCALLNVDRDVAKLPGGFDTFLSGNNTDNIPVGLQQRISMARVLATKPRILLFDNAERSLDKEGYATIYSLLARLKGTVSMVLISDDHNLHALADRHYVLQANTLLETPIPSKGNVSLYKELYL